MHILISLQPVTDKKEMVHFNAVSFVHQEMTPQVYRLLKNNGLIKPCHIKSPHKYSKTFWDIAQQYYDTGNDITALIDGLYLPDTNIMIPQGVTL